MVLTFPDPEALITIPHTNGHLIRGINHCIVRPSSENGKDLTLSLPGTVVKFSWVSKPLGASSPTCFKTAVVFSALKNIIILF